ncbi:hypothetical protein BJL95_08110 [Methylomonas sp. LWB]|uniref:nucleoside 2-deoxyribosyltransferase n=1 Tax=Methylomonas sp. LWB TaxID=1905845 RepID=UPI000918C17E|nr:nucleoside 2-deoxyribosyltransferase [Methylomonas sp. LWB]OHX37754.1 hypothetical protein BJL95_08110 [Methylomonas sp. LWB]
MKRLKKINIYFAAPLFNPVERAFNESLVARLDEYADIFLPQRDGALLTKLVSDGNTVESARNKIFKKDTSAIRNCDLVVAVLDGRTIDEGVAFELGYAFALGKTCVAYKSDDRVMLPTGDNPMIVMSCKYHCSTPDSLIDVILNINLDKLESKNSLHSSSSLHNTIYK